MHLSPHCTMLWLFCVQKTNGMYSYMYDRLNPHLTLSHVLNHCDKSSHQPSCSECYVQIFLLVSTRNNMLVLPKKWQKSPVYVCQISCPSTGIHVHALISMFGTQSFLPKKLIKRKKKTALLRMKWFLLFSIPCYRPWWGLQYLIFH